MCVTCGCMKKKGQPGYGKGPATDKKTDKKKSKKKK
jgi:hypothetical protein